MITIKSPYTNRMYQIGSTIKIKKVQSSKKVGNKTSINSHPVIISIVISVIDKLKPEVTSQ